MRAKSLKSSQILRAHMLYFRRPGHILRPGFKDVPNSQVKLRVFKYLQLGSAITLLFAELVTLIKSKETRVVTWGCFGWQKRMPTNEVMLNSEEIRRVTLAVPELLYACLKAKLLCYQLVR